MLPHVNDASAAVGSDQLDRYIDAWLLHGHAGSPDGAAALERLLALVTANVRFEDVATGIVLEGRDGIAELCTGAYEMAHDLSLTLVSRQTDGRHFAFEYVGTGSMAPTGRPVKFRTVAVGSFSSDGLVESHRGYWDRSAFLALNETP